MGKIMSAHQPNFLPYYRFFHKMANSDVFVISDNQYVKNDWHSRNKIIISGKDEARNPRSKWIRVPVNRARNCISSITIKNYVKDKKVPWNIYLLRQIKISYEKTPFFEQYFAGLEKIFMTPGEKLIDLNMNIINYLKECFDINTPVLFDRDIPGYQKADEPNQDIVNIAKAVNASIYLSGPGGPDYLKPEIFERQGIEVRFQSFEHPRYKQRFPGFIPNLAAIDILFNAGNVFKDYRKYEFQNRNDPHFLAETRAIASAIV